MEQKNNIQYSLVIPVYNEEESVAKLHKEIVTVMKELGKSYEIIFVNDASNDNTENNIKKLSPVKLITLRKNSGQSKALDIGIKNAKGEILITLDGDGQNDPNDIPAPGIWRVIQKMRAGKIPQAKMNYPAHLNFDPVSAARQVSR